MPGPPPRAVVDGPNRPRDVARSGLDCPRWAFGIRCVPPQDRVGCNHADIRIKGKRVVVQEGPMLPRRRLNLIPRTVEVGPPQSKLWVELRAGGLPSILRVLSGCIPITPICAATRQGPSVVSDVEAKGMSYTLFRSHPARCRFWVAGVFTSKSGQPRRKLSASATPRRTVNSVSGSASSGWALFGEHSTVDAQANRRCFHEDRT